MFLCIKMLKIEKRLLFCIEKISLATTFSALCAFAILNMYKKQKSQSFCEIYIQCDPRWKYSSKFYIFNSILKNISSSYIKKIEKNLLLFIEKLSLSQEENILIILIFLIRFKRIITQEDTFFYFKILRKLRKIDYYVFIEKISWPVNLAALYVS